jgi:hypothetical protein
VGRGDRGQTSVVVLIGRRDATDYMLGALKFMYETDAEGRMARFGATAIVTDEDMADWHDALRLQYPHYVNPGGEFRGPSR